MIKYITIPEQKKTVAILTGMKYDAIYRIYKFCNGTDISFDWTKYLMPEKFRSVVVCSPDDTYDVNEGKKQAKEKLLNKYYSALHEKINDFTQNIFTAYSKALDDTILSRKYEED